MTGVAEPFLPFLAEAPALTNRRPSNGARLLADALERQAASGNLDALDDAALLALYLRRSGGAEAAALALAHFGSLGRALAVDGPEKGRLSGLSSEVVLDLRLAQEIARRVPLEAVKASTVLTSWAALTTYLSVTLKHEAREQFRVLFLDKKIQLIRDEVMNRGTVDHAPVYPREVMRRALELDASSLILVHNHPSGDPSPSTADIKMTKQIVEAGKALSIVVHDHVVVGSQGVFSFRSKGLI